MRLRLWAAPIDKGGESPQNISRALNAIDPLRYLHLRRTADTGPLPSSLVFLDLAHAFTSPAVLELLERAPNIGLRYLRLPSLLYGREPEDILDACDEAGVAVVCEKQVWPESVW